LEKKGIIDFLDDNYKSFQYYLKGKFRTLDDYEIEDIVQTTIYKLLKKNKQSSSVTYLSSYVYTSLQNSAKDYFKSNQRMVLDDSPDLGEGDAVEDTVLQNELRQKLKEAINKLDEKSKYIFVETEIKGRSYEDLVEETGEKLGTLLSRKNRAKKKLQEYLKSYKEAKNV
jgi:RNA polymerase sigma-70 factor (ECF subfamily)